MFNRLQLDISVVHKQIYAFIGVAVNLAQHAYIFLVSCTFPVMTQGGGLLSVCGGNRQTQ